MKKSLIIGIIFVTLLLYSNQLSDGWDKKRQMLLDVISKKYGQIKANKLLTVYDALKKSGLPIDSLRLALSQVMHETGVFSGKQSASNYNNFSGIKFSGSKEQLATGAYKSPVSAKEDRTSFYAGYPNALSWAKDYIRIISRGSKPIHASTPEEFAKRLKQNKYYQDAESVYANALKLFSNLLSKAGI